MGSLFYTFGFLGGILLILLIGIMIVLVLENVFKDKD